MKSSGGSRIQARAFRAAAIGSAISNVTLGGANSVQADPPITSSSLHIRKIGVILRLGLSNLRGYLRHRRRKRRTKQIDKIRQALLLAGVKSAQFEISEQFSLIERKLEQVLNALKPSDQTDLTSSTLVASDRKVDSMAAPVRNFSTEAVLTSAPLDASVSPNIVKLTDA